IYDPHVGNGNLLVMSAYKIAKDNNLSKPKLDNLYGNASLNDTSYFITIIRMIFAGIRTINIKREDLSHGYNLCKNQLNTFDCILCFPPYGKFDSGRYFNRFDYPLPYSVRFKETLFLQHIMLSLTQNGRAVVCLPAATFSRSGPEAEIKNWLLSEFRIEGILSLPEYTFNVYYKTKFVILVLRKTSPSKYFWVQTVQKKEDPFDSKSFSIDIHKEIENFHSHKSNGWMVSKADFQNYGVEVETKKSADNQLEKLFNELKNADKDIEIFSLREVSNIFSGLNYAKEFSDKTFAKDSGRKTAIIQGADINNGKIAKPSKYLPGNPPQIQLTSVTKPMNEKFYLQKGDLLITRFGKLAIASEDVVGAVVSSSLFVIRPNKTIILPEYLLDILKSSSYQYWLSNYSLNTTTQSISTNTLHSLKIPVPSLETQEHIVSTFIKRAKLGLNESDASEILNSIVSQRKINEFTSFLLSNTTIQNLLTEIDSYNQTELTNKFELIISALSPWIGLMRNVDTISNDFVTGDSELDLWLSLTFDISEYIKYAFQLTGGERLAYLERANLLTKKCNSLNLQIKEALLLKIHAIDKLVLQVLENETKAILENTVISATLENPILEENKATEIVIKVKNDSALTLQKFKAKAEELETEQVSLQPGKEVSLIIQFPAKPIGKHPIQIYWEAIRFDLTKIEGNLLTTCEVRPNEKISGDSPRDLGKNPYIVGNPVDRSEMFFGRLLIINKIKRQLDTKNQANIVLLEGNRRTGKSSILKYLERTQELNKSIPVYFSFQGVEGDNKQTGLHTRDVYYSLAREILKALHKANYSIEIPNIGKIQRGRRFLADLREALNKYFEGVRPFELFEILLSESLDLVAPKRILLMLDEFDKLQEGIDNKITSPQVPENIRYLFHTYPQLSGIITGSRRLKRLREEYWSALFGLGYRIGLEPLEFEEAQLLVTKPVDNLLLYTNEARDKVVELCARQPFLIQTLCNSIFEYCVENHQIQVTTKIVDSVANELTKDNEHFRTLWDYAGTERRHFILLLIYELHKQSDIVTIDLIEIKLKESRVIIPSGERIGDDIDFLYELELLEKQKFGESTNYCIAIPLMSMWIEKNIDRADIRKRAIDEGERAYDN
ncbi:MAG: N-6 DNA methylase, partial [Blastocatellia bacterium]